MSYATFEAWRERAGSLAALEAFDATNLTLTELGAAERVSVQRRHAGIPDAPWRRARRVGRTFRSRRCRAAGRHRQPRVLARRSSPPIQASSAGQVVLGGQAAHDRRRPAGTVRLCAQPVLTSGGRFPVHAGARRRAQVTACASSRVSPRNVSPATWQPRWTMSAGVVAAGTRRRDRHRHGDSRRRDENAWPPRGGGGARHAHRLYESRRAADRAIDRSPARAGGEERARRAPFRDCAAAAAGGRGARRHGHRRWCAARVVADTGRRPPCPGAIRRRGEPRGGGELAR